jgi:uncharacterized protein YndB with AHSA1/START domain
MSAKMPDYTITLMRELNALARDVYAVWTELEKMKCWLGKVFAEGRIGGHYRFESQDESGKTYIYTGEYLVLEKGQHLVQSFLAGEPDLTSPNPYPNEFIEIRLLELSPSRTEMTFINGWDGEPVSEEFRLVAYTAWSEWLDRMEKSLIT